MCPPTWRMRYKPGPSGRSDLKRKTPTFIVVIDSRLLSVFRIQIRIHRSHVFFSLPDPDPSIIMQNNKKNLESYYFVTLFDFLSLKNNVNVPSKTNKQKKLC
jgi:hypothetical protein